MSSRHRDLLLMAYRDGSSCDQIGAELSVRIGTVKSRLYRTREDLKNEFNSAWRPVTRENYAYAGL